MTPAIPARPVTAAARSIASAALLLLSSALPLAAQNSADDAPSAENKLQFSMHVGMARDMSGFSRAAVAGAANPNASHYRFKTSAVWGAALAYTHPRNWGARADVEALGPVLVSETSRNATVNGQSVAWVGGLSLTYKPAFTCRFACVTLSAGPGGGFYELGEHTEVGRQTTRVSRTQLAYATRAGIEMRARGRYERVALGVSSYIINFAEAEGDASMSTLHHMVLTLRWSPP